MDVFELKAPHYPVVSYWVHMVDHHSKYSRILRANSKKAREV